MSRGIYDKVNKQRITIAGAQVPNVDETIIQDSSNPVAGGAVYDALQNIHINVDSTLSSTSENPVQNKVIKSALDGKLGINDVAAWAKASTKPTYTASEVGLGNVGNFKAVSTEAFQGLTDTEKSNARTNIGAGASNFSGSYNDLTNKPTIPGVQNNLTSDSTTDALSAVQGKTLKDLVDGKANSSHNHAASDINSGILGVAYGGTGASTLTSGRVLIGNGTSAIKFRTIDTTSGGTSGSSSLITSGAVNSALGKKLTAQTLAAGSTTLTFSDASITSESTIEIYANKYGIAPIDVEETIGQVTLIFDTQDTAISVYLVVK